VRSQPLTEGDSANTVPPEAPLVVPPLIPALATPPLPGPGNVWPAATHLVVGGDGRLRQSVQSTEISRCISDAVRLASSNIFFIDAFPSLHVQNQWLHQSLITILRDQGQKDPVVHEVDLRARQDNRYMSALISMVRYQLSSLLLSARFLNPIR